MFYTNNDFRVNKNASAVALSRHHTVEVAENAKPQNDKQLYHICLDVQRAFCQNRKVIFTLPVA
jgi:hypothetical protein